MCNEAALHAARSKQKVVKGVDLEYAVERVVGGTEKVSYEELLVGFSGGHRDWEIYEGNGRELPKNNPGQEGFLANGLVCWEIWRRGPFKGNIILRE